jgi:hypothetical protein
VHILLEQWCAWFARLLAGRLNSARPAAAASSDPKHNSSQSDFKGSRIVEKTWVSNRLSFVHRAEMNGR